MKIKSFAITSATTISVDSPITAPICVLRGRHSSLALDLLREYMRDFRGAESIDAYDDGRFVIMSEIELDGKLYDGCYIRNADFLGDCRFAVNFDTCGLDFSLEDTEEFLHRCEELNLDDSNVYYGNADVLPSADPRPVFIYDCFDRLDEAIDLSPIFNKLAHLGRQIFVSVCATYPDLKLAHDKVQIVEVDYNEGA